MGTTAAGVMFIGTLVAVLVAAYRFLGDHLYRVVTGTRHSIVERGVYKLVGVNPDREQAWGGYARSVLAFSAISILFLYGFLRLQNHLWLSLGFPPVMTHGAWNTAVAVALVRGLARRRTDQLGNFLGGPDPDHAAGPAAGKQLLITRGALTTFSIANDIAKYFAIIPAMFAAVYPGLDALNVMRLHSPTSAIVSAIIFNALVIVALIPLALRGVRYRPASASSLLSRNLLVYGVGGIVAPFAGIKLVDLIVQLVPGMS
jgi:Potassium-transporting ATPase A subunit